MISNITIVNITISIIVIIQYITIPLARLTEQFSPGLRRARATKSQSLNVSAIASVRPRTVWRPRVTYITFPVQSRPSLGARLTVTITLHISNIENSHYQTVHNNIKVNKNCKMISLSYYNIYKTVTIKIMS